MRTPRLATTTATALILLLAACSPTTEDPTPTPTETTATPTETATTTEPTTEPTTEDAQAVNIEAAKQALLDYNTLANEVSAAGFGGWQDELIFYWGTPEIANPLAAYYRTAADAGQRTEGSSVVASMEVTEYVEDPTGAGHEQVRITYCLDNSAVTTYDSAGAPLPKSTPPRFEWDTLLQRQDSGRWTINEETPHVDRIC